MQMTALRPWFAVLVLAGLACEAATGPTELPEDRLHIVRQDSLAPPLLTTRDSFYARVGDGREMKLYYQGTVPGDTGEEFVHFEVPGDGLWRRPDGSLFAPGDSVLITVTVVDPDRFVFRFEPAGLQFSSEHPARLKVKYLLGDHDFDDDGDEDGVDLDIEQQLGLWHQATPGGLWQQLGAVRFEELDEINANINSFSQYAVAW
jgi:hypothetical protein